MLSPQEFAEQWGESNLFRLSPDQVLGLPIPETSKNFLLEVGLPQQAQLPSSTFHLLPVYEAPSLSAGGTDYLFKRFGHYYIIGTAFYDMCIFIDGKKAGQIVYNNSSVPRKSFINSSVEQFSASLLAFKQAIDQATLEGLNTIPPELPYDAYSKGWVSLLDGLRERLLLIDLKAFDRPNSYWRMSLDEMRSQI